MKISRLMRDGKETYGIIKDGNVAAIIFRLKTKCKDRGYIEKQELELVRPFNRINLEDI